MTQHKSQVYQETGFGVAAVEQAKDGIIIIRNEALVYANPAFGEMSEYPLDELGGKPFLDLATSEHAEPLQQLHQNLMAGKGTSCIYEVSLLTKDGKVKPMEINVGLIDHEGQRALMVIVRDIAERKIVERELRQRIELDNVLLTIGNHFANSPADELGSMINEGLRILGECANADRAYILMNSEDGTRIDNINEWCAEGITPQKDNLQGMPLECMPHFSGELNRCGIVNVQSIAELPPEADGEKKLLQAQGIQSFLVVPFTGSNTPPCYLGFDSVRAERVWSEKDIELLKTTGTLFAGALARMKIREHLRISEATARILLNAPRDLMILTNPDGIIIDLNDSTAQRFERNPDEMTGSPIWDFLPPELAASRKEQFERLLKTCKPVRFQDEHDGMTLDNTLYPIFHKHGNITGIAICSNDITEAKRMEQAVKDAEKGYRELVDLLPLTVFEIDVKGNVTLTNHKGLETFGYTEEDINNGLNVRQLFITADLDRLGENIEHALAGEEQSGTEYTALRKDVSTFPATTFANLITHEGKPAGIRGVVIDSSRRKQREIEMAKSSATIEAMIDGVAVTDLQGVLLQVNGAICKQTGYSEDEMLGKTIPGLLLIQRDAHQSVEHMTQLARGKTVEGVEYTIKRKDGSEASLSLNISLLHNSEDEPDSVITISRDITKAKQAERALLEARERYQILAESANDLIVSMNISGELAFVNAAGLSLLGYTEEDVFGKNFLEFIAPDSAAKALDIFALAAGGQHPEGEISLIARDGKEVPFEVVGIPWTRDGQVIELLAILRNITDRRQHQIALEEKNAFAENILQAQQDLIFVTDREGHVIRCNKAAWETLGCSEDELFGEPWYVPEISRSLYMNTTLSVIKGRSIPDAEGTLICRDGTPIPVSFHSAPLRNEEGYIQGAVSIAKDMRGLKNTTAYYRSILDSIPETVIIIDKDHKFSYANPVFEKLVGHKKKEFEGKPISKVIAEMNIVSPELGEATVKKTKKVVETGGSTIGAEAEMIDSGGSKVPILYSSSGIKDSYGNIAGEVIVIRDMTDIKQLERELENTVERLKASQEELSTPVIQVWQGILVLPLIGLIDNYRAERIMETLLNRIMETQSELVIMDITGVKSIDTNVANHLIKTIGATKLLGTECVITGIKPEISQTMIQLGLDVESFPCRRNLRDGLLYGLKKTGHEVRDLVNTLP